MEVLRSTVLQRRVPDVRVFLRGLDPVGQFAQELHVQQRSAAVAS